MSFENEILLWFLFLCYVLFENKLQPRQGHFMQSWKGSKQSLTQNQSNCQINWGYISFSY